MAVIGQCFTGLGHDDGLNKGSGAAPDETKACGKIAGNKVQNDIASS